MKKMVLIAVVVVMLLSGCATMRLPEGATQAEKEAAYCADARQGLALAQIGLDTAATPAQRSYWARYLKGVSLAVDLYCTQVDVPK